MGNASFDAPQTLPLLLSFDEFIEGRAYQGRTQLAIRPTMGSASNLNEALALQLIEESGQASQQYTWITFSVNGSPTTTRLVIENPDRTYAARLGGARALYKSRSTNAFTYRGEDPTLYADDFSQLSGVGSQDLGPVIHLLRWLQQSDAETFDRELGDWVDIPAFARYVATHDLLNNFDDMAGPGRNFLLSYDLDSRLFTVITWDMNLAISGMGGGGPPGGFGLPGGGRGFGPPGGGRGFGPPGGGRGFGPPGGAPPVGARGFGPPGGPADGGGFGGMGNQLKSRFLESTAFADVRNAARDELNALWFTSGRAAALVAELSRYVPVSDSLTAEQISREADSLSATVTRN
jgi:spore coat protein CotH